MQFMFTYITYDLLMCVIYLWLTYGLLMFFYYLIYLSSMIYVYCSILSTDYDSYKINNNSNPSPLNLDIDNLTENLSTLNTNINDNYV